MEGTERAERVNNTAPAAANDDDGGDVDDDLEKDDDNDEEMATDRPALPPSDWRACRCNGSQDLKNPTDTDIKLIWDMDLLPEKADVKDLEDINGWYKLVDCNKTTSDAELKEKIDKRIKHERKRMIKYHQDRQQQGTADEKKYKKAKNNHDMLKRMQKEFCTKDDDGCFAGRVKYDKKGEELIERMEQVSFIEICAVAFIFIISNLINILLHPIFYFNN